jgi:hypothetical protein
VGVQPIQLSLQLLYLHQHELMQQQAAGGTESSITLDTQTNYNSQLQ